MTEGDVSSFEDINRAIAEKLKLQNELTSILEPQLSKKHLMPKSLTPVSNAPNQHRANITNTFNPAIGNPNHIAVYPNLALSVNAIELNVLKDKAKDKPMAKKSQYDDRIYANISAVERPYLDPDARGQLYEAIKNNPSYKHRQMAQSLLTDKSNVSRVITDKSTIRELAHRDISNPVTSIMSAPVQMNTDSKPHITENKISPVKISSVENDENIKKEKYAKMETRNFKEQFNDQRFYQNNLTLKNDNINYRNIDTLSNKEILDELKQQLVLFVENERLADPIKIQLINTFHSMPEEKQLEILQYKKEEIKKNLFTKDVIKRVLELMKLPEIAKYQYNSFVRNTSSLRIEDIVHKLPEEKQKEIYFYIYHQLKNFGIEHYDQRVMMEEISDILKPLNFFQKETIKKEVKRMFETLKLMPEVEWQQIYRTIFNQEIRMRVDQMAMIRKLSKELNFQLSERSCFINNMEFKFMKIRDDLGLAIVIDDFAPSDMKIVIVDDFVQLERIINNINPVPKNITEMENLKVLPIYLDNFSAINVNTSTFNTIVNEYKEIKDMIELLKLCQYYEDFKYKRLNQNNFSIYQRSEIDGLHKKLERLFIKNTEREQYKKLNYTFEHSRIKKSNIGDKYVK